MTKKNKLKNIIITLSLILVTFTAKGNELRITYLDLKNDYRYDENLLYARIQLKPTGRPLVAVKIAEEESKIIGDALDVNFILDNYSFDNVSDLNNHINNNDQSFIFIVDLDTDNLNWLSQNILKKNIIIFNISSYNNSLRTDLSKFLKNYRD